MHCCLGGEDKGCGQRICKDHDHSKLIVVQDEDQVTVVDIIYSCIKCGRELDVDEKTNAKCECLVWLFCSCLPLIIIAIVILNFTL